MRGRPVEPGNKQGRGRPRGTARKKTEFAEAFEEHGHSIIKQCQYMAMKGDPTALKLCVERIVPPCEPLRPKFNLPPIDTGADIAPAFRAVFKEVAKGKVTVRDAEGVTRMLESRRRQAEQDEYGPRLEALEKKVSERENEH